MTDLLDHYATATLSDDEVLPWVNTTFGASRFLSSGEIRTPATRFSQIAIGTGPTPSARTWRPRDLVEPLLWLQDNWDGFEAAAPSVMALRQTTRFLEVLAEVEDFPAPDVMPSVEGGVLLEWEVDTAEVLISIGPHGATNVYAKSEDEEYEGSLAPGNPILQNALVALVSH